MKTIVAIVVTLLLLAPDWAALHDILAGEPDLSGEYAMVVLSIIAFAAMAFIGGGRRKRTGRLTP